jgi:DNA-binding response OmpR family regulator
MTMTAEHQALRAVVVTNETTIDASQPTCRLLSELGHDVAGAASPDEAMNILQDAGADLLVIDLSTLDQKRRMFERLAALPREFKPTRVALFSDEADDFTRSLHRDHDNSRVHVFIKPLHLHGLLNVLRHIEGRNLATA